MPFLPLAGVRVVDVTTSIAGSYCAEILAELGVEDAELSALSEDGVVAAPSRSASG